jgi:hypothetical protein
MKKLSIIVATCAAALAFLPASAQTTTGATKKSPQKVEAQKERKSGDASMVKTENREMKAAEHKEEKAAKKATVSAKNAKPIDKKAVPTQKQKSEIQKPKVSATQAKPVDKQ